MPMVTKNFNEKSLNAAFVLEEQSIQEAVKTLLVNENTDDYKKTTLWYTGEEELTTYEQTSGAFVNKYFKVSKYCGDSNGKCFAPVYYEFKYRDKSIYKPEFKGACASLKNGSSVCMAPQTDTEPVKVLLDINGKKGPNVLGRDLRAFEIQLPSKEELDRTSSIVEWTPILIDLGGSPPPPPSPCEVGGSGTDEECCTNNDYASRHLSCCNINFSKEKCCTPGSTDPRCSGDTRSFSMVTECTNFDNAREYGRAQDLCGGAFYLLYGNVSCGIFVTSGSEDAVALLKSASIRMDDYSFGKQYSASTKNFAKTSKYLKAVKFISMGSYDDVIYKGTSQPTAGCDYVRYQTSASTPKRAPICSFTLNSNNNSITLRTPDNVMYNTDNVQHSDLIHNAFGYSYFRSCSGAWECETDGVKLIKCDLAGPLDSSEMNFFTSSDF